MTKIPFSSYYNRQQPGPGSWPSSMAELLRKYLQDEPIYVSFDEGYEPKRKGSIGRLVINNVQDLLHGSYEINYRGVFNPRKPIPELPENVKEEHFTKVQITGHVVWEGRKNRVQFHSYITFWEKDHKPEIGTVWAYEKPEDKPQALAYDKLDREIKVGDFISYILYHFNNDRNAAGIYYGKVTKIDKDGTVYAKNIKLKEDDIVAEKRIKDNSLIVIMTKDLMDKLMMARLSIL